MSPSGLPRVDSEDVEAVDNATPMKLDDEEGPVLPIRDGGLEH